MRTRELLEEATDALKRIVALWDPAYEREPAWVAIARDALAYIRNNRTTGDAL